MANVRKKRSLTFTFHYKVDFVKMYNNKFFFFSVWNGTGIYLNYLDILIYHRNNLIFRMFTNYIVD